VSKFDVGWVGAPPTPDWGSSQRSTDPLAACKGREEGMSWEQKGGKRRGGKGMKGRNEERALPL